MPKQRISLQRIEHNQTKYISDTHEVEEQTDLFY